MSEEKEKESISFEKFADQNLSEESVNEVLEMEKQGNHIPEKLTSGEWKMWCDAHIFTTFNAYIVEIDLEGEKAQELIEYLFPSESYPELNATSILIYNDGAIYLDDDSDPFQYLNPGNQSPQEAIEDLKEKFNL